MCIRWSILSMITLISLESRCGANTLNSEEKELVLETYVWAGKRNIDIVLYNLFGTDKSFRTEIFSALCYYDHYEMNLVVPNLRNKFSTHWKESIYSKVCFAGLPWFILRVYYVYIYLHLIIHWFSRFNYYFLLRLIIFPIIPYFANTQILETRWRWCLFDNIKYSKAPRFHTLSISRKIF